MSSNVTYVENSRDHEVRRDGNITLKLEYSFRVRRGCFLRCLGAFQATHQRRKGRCLTFESTRQTYSRR